MIRFLNALLLSFFYIFSNTQGTINIHWMNRQWNVRNTTRAPGKPHNNYFPASNVYVDNNKGLHLNVKNNGSMWTASEVCTAEDFSYGVFEYQIEADIEKFDRQIVFAIFLLPIKLDGGNEIDVQFAKWNVYNRTNNMDFTLHPRTFPNGSSQKIAYWKQFQRVNKFNNVTSLRISWQPDQIIWEGYFGKAYNYDQLFARKVLNQIDSPIKIIPNKRLRLCLNLWVFKNDPKIGPIGKRPIEVIFNKFVYSQIYQFDWRGLSWVANDNTKGMLSSSSIFSSKNIFINNQVLSFQLNTNSSGFSIGSNIQSVSLFQYGMFQWNISNSVNNLYPSLQFTLSLSGSSLISNDIEIGFSKWNGSSILYQISSGYQQSTTQYVEFKNSGDSSHSIVWNEDSIYLQSSQKLNNKKYAISKFNRNGMNPEYQTIKMKYLPKNTFISSNMIFPIISIQSFNFSPNAIYWSNLTWKVRSNTPYSPYSISYKTIQFVKFQIVKTRNTQSSACLTSIESNFTYGVYDIQIGSHIFTMNPNTVFGIYLTDGFLKIDRISIQLKQNSSLTLTYKASSRIHSVNIGSHEMNTTHRIIWLPNRIVFQSFNPFSILISSAIIQTPINNFLQANIRYQIQTGKNISFNSNQINVNKFIFNPLAYFRWDGYTWMIRQQDTIKAGIAPNLYSSSIITMKNQILSLRIANLSNAWSCSQISSIDLFNYGQYFWQLNSSFVQHPNIGFQISLQSPNQNGNQINIVMSQSTLRYEVINKGIKTSVFPELPSTFKFPNNTMFGLYYHPSRTILSIYSKQNSEFRIRNSKTLLTQGIGTSLQVMMRFWLLNPQNVQRMPQTSQMVINGFLYKSQ